MNPPGRLRIELKKQNVDVALISSVPNIIYLTGYAGFSKIHREGFIIMTKKRNYIITSPLHTEDVEKNTKGFGIITMQRRSYFSDVLEKLSKQYTTAGIETGDLKVAEYIKVKKFFKAKSIDLTGLRTIKTSEEILNIKRACAISDKVYSYVLKNIKIGMTEKELAFEISYQMKKLGGDIAFETIVAFGKNTSVPHHLPGNTKLKRDDVVLLDFGASWNNYISDVSRTFVFGKATSRFKKMYEACLSAQEKSIKFLQNTLYKIQNTEVKAAEVDSVARQNIKQNGYSDFPHALGHGFGIDVHEPPILSLLSKDIVEPNAPFTLEPGIYIPGFAGVRIEDDFIIQNGKLITLTKSKRELIEL